MKIYSLLTVLIGVGMWSGCEMINPEEEIPTYIRIDSLRFIQRGDTFGSGSHRFSSVWVYADNEPLGAFEMPAVIPVLTGQSAIITIAAGIDYNGMKSFQYPYPFYAFDSMTLTPDPGKVISMDAKTHYTDATRVLYNSTMDLGNPFSRFEGDTAMIRTTDPDYVFEGGGAGYIYIDGPKRTSQNISIDPFRATAGQDIFVEIDYRCSIPFQVGVAAFFSDGSENREYVGGVNARDEWNKIYISLKEFIGANQGGQYHLMLRTGTDNGESSGWVAIDNIKIVSF